MEMEPDLDRPSYPQIMTFYPSEEEFKDFTKYVEYMESKGAHKAGIAKVVPPASWVPRRSGYDNLNIDIPTPIKQTVVGAQGKYQQYNKPKKTMHIRDFKAMATSRKYRPPDVDSDMDALERKYWKNICFNSAIYGADVPMSLYDDDQDVWNPGRLNTILDVIKEDYNTEIEGVTTTYLYFGMWKSTFPWHTEDMDLYSINYLHFGAPKFWYAVPTEYGRRLERLAESYFPDEKKGCANFLRHKNTILSPSILQQNNIPYNKIQQGPRDFIISFPFAYHAGFNTGFNCAESTNFATMRWIEYGKRAIHCDCRPNMVRFSMRCFVKRFQPDRFELFESDLDIAPHPEDDFCLIRGAGPNGVRGIGRQVFSDPSYIISDSEEKKMMKMRMMMSKRHPLHLEGDDAKPKRGRKRKSFDGESPFGSLLPASTSTHVAADVKSPFATSALSPGDSTQGYVCILHSSDAEDTQPLEGINEPAESGKKPCLQFSGSLKCQNLLVPKSVVESSSNFSKVIAFVKSLPQLSSTHANQTSGNVIISPLNRLETLVGRVRKHDVEMQAIAATLPSPPPPPPLFESPKQSSKKSLPSPAKKSSPSKPHPSWIPFQPSSSSIVTFYIKDSHI